MPPVHGRHPLLCLGPDPKRSDAVGALPHRGAPSGRRLHLSAREAVPTTKLGLARRDQLQPGGWPRDGWEQQCWGPGLVHKRLWHRELPPTVCARVAAVARLLVANKGTHGVGRAGEGDCVDPNLEGKSGGGSEAGVCEKGIVLIPTLKARVGVGVRL
eukprot:scaffold22084_cov117-Isochrysis_galbana.AAC.1